MLKNNEISFDQVFDLMVGQKNEGRYTDEKIEEMGAKEVELVVEVKDKTGFRWETINLGKAGDKIKTTKHANYALYDNNGLTGMFHLSRNKIKNDVSLKDIVQEKRNGMINKSQAPKSSI